MGLVFFFLSATSVSAQEEQAPADPAVTEAAEGQVEEQVEEQVEAEPEDAAIEETPAEARARIRRTLAGAVRDLRLARSDETVDEAEIAIRRLAVVEAAAQAEAMLTAPAPIPPPPVVVPEAPLEVQVAPLVCEHDEDEDEEEEDNPFAFFEDPVVWIVVAVIVGAIVVSLVLDGANTAAETVPGDDGIVVQTLIEWP